MLEAQPLSITVVFGLVIVCIALNVADMTLLAMLGLCALTLGGLVTHNDVFNAIRASSGSLALLFGGMVVARVLAPTGIFGNLGTRFLLLTGGSGRRFLLLLTAMTSVVCAILPNATAVILIAPIVIGVCKELDTDFTGPLILTAVISNAAGLLTLVGDPATFLVGQAAGLSFTEYLRKISPGGLLSILVVIPLMPLLFGPCWKARRRLSADLRPQPIARPGFCFLALGALAVMVALFLVGDFLPVTVVPPSAAIIGASLALFALHVSRYESTEAVFRDIDWRTLVFIFCMMCFVEEITKTGIMSGLSRMLYAGVGDRLLEAALVLLAAIGLLSGFLANIPVVAAAVLLAKGYMVMAKLVPEFALGFGYSDWPAASLPVFAGMMFGGTLGGNVTLIGSSATLVAAGISASHGKPIAFAAFMRYGVPIAMCQLGVAAFYVWLLSLMARP
ncbi:SLC13 family permease [Solidesulfovibrio alcoholivorans]|uniref:SLC13 family permease n=1 Tax=Solidesulfovibrio alcoholivorans TaxID=81406 RepID=UPI0004976C60|nr:SLC13 family permease [Solidesulfovibrio alcoholivorans]